MTCIAPSELAEARIDRVLTQYRESPNLLFLMRNYLIAAAEATQTVCELPEKFALDSAVGDQLTVLGKRMGWPRCHCVCEVEPVFGFDCLDEFNLRPIVGFCDPNATWDGCSSGISEVCIADDAAYRKFLQVRAYQYLNRYDLASLEECIKILFGETASVLYAGEGRVVIAPGRDLTSSEINLLQLYPRVLPVALGVRVMFHFGSKRVFGFGEGWGGFEEDDLTKTQQSLAYQKTEKIFGFCDDWGGFCESWEEDGLPLSTGNFDVDGNEILLVDDLGNELYTGPLKADSAWLCKTSAPWMCEIDVRPYDC